MALRDLAYSISPTWLQGEIGEKYIYSQALIVDATADRVEQGTRAKMPGKCDPTALPCIARDRGVVKGIGDTDATYAERCRTAVTDWHFSGIAGGTMRVLLDFITIDVRPACSVVWASNGGTNLTQWYTLAEAEPRGTAPNSFSNLSATPYFFDWTWDAIENRRRFWIILHINAAGTPWIADGRTYADGSTYGDGHLYGVSGITAAQVETLRQLAGQWKAAHACCQIVVALDATSFDPFSTASLPGANATLPNGTWLNFGHDVAGAYVPARLSTARYLGAST